MNVASSELCKELYALTLWDANATGFSHMPDGSVAFGWHQEGIPAYDLGYLLRKLPQDELYRTDMAREKGQWAAYLWGPSPFKALGASNLIVIARGLDETPENAAAKLAIALLEEEDWREKLRGNR